MSLFRREVRQWTPEPIVPPFPGSSVFGMGSPTVDRAMQNQNVWACVHLLADTVSMMPLHGYTMRAGVRVPTEDPPLIVRPSADATPSEWIYMAMVSLLTRGNCFGDKVRTVNGYPVQIEWVDPETVRTDFRDGRPVTYYNGKEMPPERVAQLRAYRMPGRRNGLSPIQYGAGPINTEAAVAAFALDFFRNGAHPSSILASDEKLTQEQAATAKKRFIEAVADRNPAVLSGGLKYTPIQVSPEESQFLATQKYGVTEIARLFRVPPEMIGGEAGNSMTYANVEQRALDFLTYSVQPWLTRLENALAQMLPGKQHVRFDTSVLTRTDFLTTMQATAIGIASKQTTPDEARAHRDEPPLTDDQKAVLDLVPLEITPAGKPRLGPGAAAAQIPDAGGPA